MRFASLTVKNWDTLIEKIPRSKTDWMYRAQAQDWPLSTSLERACSQSGILPSDVPKIEKQLVRAFRRRYDGADRQYVLADTVYALSLMQHHGAPTRFLDFTYSPYVAIFFALNSLPAGLEHSPVIWCFNRHWCNKEIRRITGEIDLNTIDILPTGSAEKSDERFHKLYRSSPGNKFFGVESPFLFHSRLRTQQGVFVCPGDSTSTTEVNIKAMNGWSEMRFILKIKLNFSKKTRWEIMNHLQNMNITEESIFPDLDGFCRSLRHRLDYLLSVEDQAESPPKGLAI